MQVQPLPIVRACEVLGGQAELARALDITPGAVNQWCKGVREVPAERCPEIERLTRSKGAAVHCEELRPDVNWGVLRESSLPTTTPGPLDATEPEAA